MKKVIMLGLVGILVVFGFSGCKSIFESTDNTTIEEYSNSVLTKKTTTTLTKKESESLVKTIVNSTQNKTVIMWRRGWAGGVEATIFSEENPLPVLRAFGAKDDEGVVTIPKDQKGTENIPAIVSAATATEGVSISKDGIGSTGISGTGTSLSKLTESDTTDSGTAGK